MGLYSVTANIPSFGPYHLGSACRPSFQLPSCASPCARCRKGCLAAATHSALCSFSQETRKVLKSKSPWSSQVDSQGTWHINPPVRGKTSNAFAYLSQPLSIPHSPVLPHLSNDLLPPTLLSQAVLCQSARLHKVAHTLS